MQTSPRTVANPRAILCAVETEPAVSGAATGVRAKRGGGYRVRLQGFWARFPHRGLIQAAVVITAQGLSSVANFFSGVVLARACSQAEYGVYVQCLVLLSILSGIDMSFTGYPYTILQPQRERGQQCTYLRNTLVLQLGILCTIALLFLSVGVGLSLLRVSAPVVRTVYVLSLAGPVFLLRDFATVMILANLRVWRNLLMIAGASMATVAGLGFCYVSQRLTVPVAFVVFTVCTGLPVGAMLYFDLWTDSAVRPGSFGTDVWGNWRIGKWLVAKTIAHTGAVSVLPFLLGSFHGAKQTAVYGVCLAYANLINPLFAGFCGFFRPRAAHTNAVRPDRLRPMTLLCILALSVPLAAFLLATVEWGDTIIVALFGHRYSHLGILLVLAVLANSFFVLSAPLSIAIDAQERTNATFRGRLAGCLVSLALGTVFIWYWGPLGALGAFALANLSTSLYWLKEFLSGPTPGLGRGGIPTLVGGA